MSWMPPKHRLLSPITADDGGQIEQIQLKPLLYAAQKEALARAGDDEDDQFFALAKLATGLSDKVLDQLKRPDYVSIAQYVHDMSTRPASYFLEQSAEAQRATGEGRSAGVGSRPGATAAAAGPGRAQHQLAEPGNARVAGDQGDEDAEDGQGTGRVHHRPLHRADDSRSGPSHRTTEIYTLSLHDALPIWPISPYLTGPSCRCVSMIF